MKGLSVAAAGEVADEALQRTHEIVTRMLAGRPDILEAMAKNGTRLIVSGKDQVYTDMPEFTLVEETLAYQGHVDWRIKR